jgi:release factor glutamine methyltransferase
MVDEETVGVYHQWVERRLKREPAAYIIGSANFMGFDFELTPDVLIPRPETELLVEDVLMEVRDRDLRAPRISDVGTGSGCIAISLARLLPEAEITGIDIDEKALAVAQKNSLKMGTNVALIQADLLSGLPQIWEGGFDMIVSNPPYIASSEISRLEPEISFEPRLALDAGIDGLLLINRLVKQSVNFLKTGGLLVLEIGHDQGARVQDLLSANGFKNISILKDYSGLDRIAKGTLIGPV